MLSVSLENRTGGYASASTLVLKDMSTVQTNGNMYTSTNAVISMVLTILCLLCLAFSEYSFSLVKVDTSTSYENVCDYAYE